MIASEEIRNRNRRLLATSLAARVIHRDVKRPPQKLPPEPKHARRSQVNLLTAGVRLHALEQPTDLTGGGDSRLAAGRNVFRLLFAEDFFNAVRFGGVVGVDGN